MKKKPEHSPDHEKSAMKTHRGTPKPDTAALGAKLLELRMAHNYAQADIASACEIDQSTYSIYERGKSMPNALILFRIANFYGLKTDDLLRICYPLDPDIFYDAGGDSYELQDMNDFLLYRKQAHENLSDNALRLLYYYSGLSPAGQRLLIDFASFMKSRRN